MRKAIEYTEIRQAIEGLTAARAAVSATDAQRTELRAIGEQMTAAVAEGDRVRHSDLSRRLHELIQECAQHEAAAEVLDQLAKQTIRHRRQVAMMPGRLESSFEEHIEIIDAICNRDPERARLTVTSHQDGTIDVLKQLESIAD